VKLRRIVGGYERIVEREYNSRHASQARDCALLLQGAIEVLEVMDNQTGKRFVGRRRRRA
jgi:hypothetical protein